MSSRLIIISFTACLFSLTITAQKFDWARSFYGKSYDDVWDLEQDIWGNSYILVEFYDSTDVDPGPTQTWVSKKQLIKLDSSGKLIWNIKPPGGPGDDIKITVFQEYIYVTGIFGSTMDFDPGPATYTMSPTGAYSMYIMKLDTAGNFIWAKAVTSTNSVDVRDITVDTSGNVYSTGQFSGQVDFDPGSGFFYLWESSGGTIYILKLNASGDFIFAGQMGGFYAETGLAVSTDQKKNIYLTGYFSATGDFDPGTGTYNLSAGSGNDVFAVKLDSTGTLKWAVNFGSSGYDCRGYGIKPDGYGNVFISGNFTGTVDFDPGPGTYTLASTPPVYINRTDLFVVKLDKDGKLIFAKSVGGSLYDVNNSLDVDKFGSSYITGYFMSTVDFDPGPGAYTVTAGSNPALYALKLDSSGNFQWLHYLTNIAYGDYISVNNLGNVLVLGTFMGTLDFDPDSTSNLYMSSWGQTDVFVARFTQEGFSQTIGITQPDSQRPPLLYPNPSTGQLFIKSDGKLQAVSLFSSEGKELFKCDLCKELDLSSLSAGSYYVRIKTPEGVFTKKIILAK
jgi:hypothetical protein